MTTIIERGRALRAAVRAELAARYPTLMRRAALARAPDRSAIVLGRNPSGGAVVLPEEVRLEHMHVIGTTGGGKSKFLEHCIRQDIVDGRGVCVVDPHGEHPDSLYRALLGWLHASGYAQRRTVHLIDPSAPSHTVGFNPLARPDAATDLSVLSGVTLEAFSRAWGGEDTTAKPTIERVLTAVFIALADLGLTLVEAPMLLDREDRHGLRAHALDAVRDDYAREELRRLHSLSRDDRRRHDFDLEVVGPLNRLARFVRPSAIRAMLGQTERTLDVRRAFDEGEIILCNLSGGSRVYERDADLLGRLLTRLLFFHAKRRHAPQRPFFIYLDECHRYLSGDLENILAESRKYGIGALLSHQWQAQLANESEAMLAAVRNATNVKVVFRVKDPVEAEQLAAAVVPLDLEMPVNALVRPTVVGHRRIRLGNESRSVHASDTHAEGDMRATAKTVSIAYSESEGESSGRNEFSGMSEALGLSAGTLQTNIPGGMLGGGTPASIGLTTGESAFSGTSQGSGASVSSFSSSASSVGIAKSKVSAKSITDAHTEGLSESSGTSEALEPILEDRPTAIHGKDAMLYMAAQTLRNLTTGTAFLNYVGRAGMMPTLVKVPHIASPRLSDDTFAALRAAMLSRSAAAIPADVAANAVTQRQQAFLAAKQRAEHPPEPESFRVEAPPAVLRRGMSGPVAPRRGTTRKAGTTKGSS